jgi:hypothetical protein
MTRQFLALLTAILVMAFSSLMLTRISDAEVDPKTALGVWLFEDGTGKKAMDSSGNDNHGELVKNPKWAKGKFGGALELNGRSSHVSVPHIPDWNFGKKDFTIALWINMKEKRNYSGCISVVKGMNGWPRSAFSMARTTLRPCLRTVEM